MDIKKIIIDGEEIEIALKLDESYYEKNNHLNLEDTLKLDELKKLNGELEDEKAN